MGQPEFVGHVQNQTTRNQIGKIQGKRDYQKN